MGGHVAPFTGAWIEICNDVADVTGAAESLSSRERGLKLQRQAALDSNTRSLPSWERGLGMPLRMVFCLRYVPPPPVEAWIGKPIMLL